MVSLKDQKSQFGYILQDHRIENVGRSFGTFFPFWYVWTKKNLATLPLSDIKWLDFDSQSHSDLK
jgi:hypothetical protein